MSEALRKAAAAVVARWDSPDWKDGTHTADYINALRDALAEPEQSEPVAWMFQHDETGRTTCVDVQQVEWGWEANNPRWHKVRALYAAAPPRREPLTREQVKQILREAEYDTATAQERADFINGIRHGEAAHGIGGKE